MSAKAVGAWCATTPTKSGLENIPCAELPNGMPSKKLCKSSAESKPKYTLAWLVVLWSWWWQCPFGWLVCKCPCSTPCENCSKKSCNKKPNATKKPVNLVWLCTKSSGKRCVVAVANKKPPEAMSSNRTCFNEKLGK